MSLLAGNDAFSTSLLPGCRDHWQMGHAEREIDQNRGGAEEACQELNREREYFSAGLLITGDSASLRVSFAFFVIDERYGSPKGAKLRIAALNRARRGCTLERSSSYPVKRGRR